MLVSLDYLNQLRHIANGIHDGDGEGVMKDMLEALIPILPPMVGGVVSKMLQDLNSNPTQITMENIDDVRPDYP